MPYVISKFGSLDLPPYEGSNDVGAGQILGEPLALPGGGIFDFYGSETGVRGLRQVRKVGEIVASDADDFRTQVNALRALVFSRAKLWREWDDGTLEWTYARLSSLEASRGIGQIFYQPYTMNFTILSPIWYGEDLQTSQADYFGGTANITLTNNGNAPVDNAILTIKNPSGTDSSITAFTISKSGETDIDYSGTLTTGQSVVIDCGAMSITKAGVDDYANLALGGNHAIAGWLRLDPGDNDITVTFTGGAAGSIAAYTLTGIMGPPTYSAAIASTDDVLNIKATFYDGWR